MTDNYLEDVFIPFITEHKENAYRIAYSYVKNSEDALDIVQESIQKAIIALKKLTDLTYIKSWFYRIIIYTSIDFLRKRKKEQVVEEEVLEVYSSGKEDVYHDLDLYKALNELPDKYRIIIILRFFEDLKIEQISLILEEKSSTIKTRLYKALKMLRISLEDDSFL